ncbi:MAG: disulfide bond formation protein B [Parcubacteria group bacterium]|nr:disulfide bond formation protein B [Parcubacteria group bacterium]
MDSVTVLATNIFSVGTLFLQAAVVAVLGARIGRRYIPVSGRFLEMLAKIAVPVSTILALGGVGGSVYYSEIAGFSPCILCLYQRTILIMLLGLLILIGAWGRNRLTRAALLFSGVGALVSAYHYAIQFFGISAICSYGVASCSSRYVFTFGYITLPLMSFTIFAVIALLLLMRRGSAT